MTLTIYGAKSKLTDAHQQIETKSGYYFVRVTESNESDYDALENAEPIDGETVLNTVELD